MNAASGAVITFESSMTQSLLATALPVLLVLLALGVALPALALLARFPGYRSSSYARLTGRPLLRTMMDRGASGEYQLSRQLERAVTDPRMLLNVYVPKPDGSTAEIDLILVTTRAVYVFECKNYSGWIFGGGTQRQWTQSLNGRVRNNFYSPVLQNESHVRTLSRYLAMPKVPLVPVIVFGDHCELKRIEPCDCPVLKMSDVVSYLHTDLESRQDVLSPEEAGRLCAILSGLCDVSQKAREEHVNRVRASSEKSGGGRRG